jgi:hypothetical protein
MGKPTVPRGRISTMISGWRTPSEDTEAVDAVQCERPRHRFSEAFGNSSRKDSWR